MSWLAYPSWLNAGDNAWQMTAATFVGLMSLIRALWTQLDETRAGVRRLAWWTLFGVSLQGVLQKRARPVA